MTVVWDKIERLAKEFESRFDQTGTRLESDLYQYDWPNTLWTSNLYRRAHIEIVDKRDTHKMFILHTTVFPHVDDVQPIWGFDAVCGPNKITGAFHDFSTPDFSCETYKWFESFSQTLVWNKKRALPEWATQIFSPAMIAAGNLQDTVEIDQLCAAAITSLDFYLNSVGKNRGFGSNLTEFQNRYCYWQKKNPQVIKSMIAMGVPESTMEQFVDEVLFPEI